MENSFIPDESSFRFVFITFKIDNSKNLEKLNELNHLLLQENAPIKLDNSDFVHEIFYKIQKDFYLKPQDYMLRIKLLLGELFLKISDQCYSNYLNNQEFYQ